MSAPHARDPRWGTVWITGASSGIGAAFARLLDAENEARHIAVSARSEDKLRALQEDSAAIAAYPLDVTDADAMRRTVAAIEDAAGPIDLAVLGAGVWHMRNVDELSVEAARDSIEVNYMGTVHAIDALLPGMMARRRGHIAIVASVAGYRGLPRSAVYGPTKAALINLAETLNTELAFHGVSVSIVNPGFVDTPMTKNNPFPMPGIISAEKAARRLLSGLEKERYEIAFPRLFAAAAKSLRFLPNALFFWISRRFLVSKSQG